MNDAYLMCLLSGMDLYLQDIRASPHGQSPATYGKSMDGKPWVPPKHKGAIENGTGGQRRRTLQGGRLDTLEDVNADVSSFPELDISHLCLGASPDQDISSQNVVTKVAVGRPHLDIQVDILSRQLCIFAIMNSTYMSLDFGIPIRGPFRA